MSSRETFGDWLKFRRRALDLTREELAARVGCSVATIRKLEAEERRPSKQLAERLAMLLGIPHEQREAFISFARSGLAEQSEELLSSSSQAAPPFVAGQKPSRPFRVPQPPTRLIGRKHERGLVCRYLAHADTQLVTLVGPAGVGKTRLSLEVALELREVFDDGVYFVELAVLSDPELLLPAIASAIGAPAQPQQPPLAQLLAEIGERQMLLVLDNLEHLTAAAPLIAELLAGCPLLHILATSRTPLRLRGEQLVPIEPLALPDPAQIQEQPPDLAALSEVPALALFLERVRAIEPRFQLNAETLATAAAICTQLDGLPLAIELIAARIRVLPPQALLQRLAGDGEHPSLALLARGAADLPRRQQTLAAAIDWSYQLLSPLEQQIFVCTAVCLGSWSLAAAEAICRQAGIVPTAVLDGLQTLSESSLISAVAPLDGEPRFTMLKTLREYALLRLAERDDAGSIRRAHAEFYLALAEQAEQHLTGPEQQVWLTRLEAEHPNLRAALQWALEQQQSGLAARIAGSLQRFWIMRGHVPEGRQWTEQILACQQSGSGSADPAAAAVWGKLLFAAGALAHQQADPQARHDYEQSLQLRQQAGDLAGMAGTLTNLGVLAYDQGDYASSQQLMEEALALRRSLNDSWGVAIALNNLGVLAAARGDLEATEAYYSESLELRREIGDIEGVANSLGNLGAIAYSRGNYLLALQHYQESLRLRRQLGNVRGVAFVLHHLGIVQLALNAVERAHELLRESLQLYVEQGDKLGVAACLEGFARGALRRAPESAEASVRAACLLGAAHSLRERLRTPAPPFMAEIAQQSEQQARATLGEAAFGSAWQQGRQLSLEQVLEYAQQSQAQPPARMHS